jgi:quercetin dioxygenase-like cupin family protein
MNTAHLDELDAIELPDGFVWRPLRRRFGIKGFGVNVYTPGASGRVIEEHTEDTYGHEEIYLVLRGRVRFTVGDDDHELGAGQLVCITDPTLRRGGEALSDDAAVLAVGGRPGEPFRVSAWEVTFGAMPLAAAGDYDEAIRLHAEALADEPDHPSLLYNLACMESLGGHRDDALAHLRRAVQLEPKWAGYAATDADFDPIREAPGFPAAPAESPET